MFILPISEHIFILRVLKRLFYVKTRDENLFKNVKSNWDNKVSSLNETFTQKVDNWNKSARNILGSSLNSSTINNSASRLGGDLNTTNNNQTDRSSKGRRESKLTVSSHPSHKDCIDEDHSEELQYKEISMSWFQNFKIFLVCKSGGYWPSSWWKKEVTLSYMIQETRNRLETNMDILRILRDIEFFNFYL